ncbi:MAG TPA: peptidoglycan DD-metalloendopeptidase family protein [Flavisolibacter sp.]|nr:peptidoglycan DD-metalloendopeptidase family protein [Flavisolibacter sp.]
MSETQELRSVLENYLNGFYPVVPFRAGEDKLLLMDFTDGNLALELEVLRDTARFSSYVSGLLKREGATYGIGGYNEHRTIYKRSDVFDAADGVEPRRLHLGVDIWGPAGVPVYAPLPGSVHSFAFNDAFGDYGATLILEHELEGMIFYTLYGHLSLHSIEDKQEGASVEKGQWIAAFGEPAENGQWPPHLHFQIIGHLGAYQGDYPGVCALSEKQGYLANCPDPDVVLNMMRFATK